MSSPALTRTSGAPGTQLRSVALRIPEQDATAPAAGNPLVLRAVLWAAVFILLGLALAVAWRIFLAGDGGQSGFEIIEGALRSPAFWSAVAVGLVAQGIDGALGMAYGITATTFLLGTGATPAGASAAVHIAEVFTTGVSGISHIKLGNVCQRLFLKLLLPGATGAVLGALLVTQVDGKALKPWISAYLLAMGLYILCKALRKTVGRRQPRHVAKVALVGGFVDATGGGGWGPVVTTNLMGAGSDPRTTIGSVNLAEFFLTLTASTAFILLAGEPTTWLMVAGLVVGGMFAAPFAAMLTRRLQARTLLVIVGCLVSVMSSFNLYKALL